MKIIILGASQVGMSVAEVLASEANDITIVDRDAEQLRILQDHLDIRTVLGQASHPDVLRKAGAYFLDKQGSSPDVSESELIRVAVHALGLAELMASQGASADDIFQVLKGVSPFWFPNQYHQLALYFEGQDQEWEDVDARAVMGKEYSSSGGFQQVSALLEQQGALGGGGPAGGKASSCAP